MGDVNATHIRVVSDILKRSNVTEAKLQALDFFLGELVLIIFSLMFYNFRFFE